MIATDTRAIWLEIRRRTIGASDAAAILGLHPWVSPLALFYDKTGELAVDEEPSEAMEWGLLLEPVVARVWSERTGRRLLKFEPYDPTALQTHPDHVWMAANLDGVVLDDIDGWEAVYEGKTCSAFADDEWADGVPAHVLVQCQWQMAVTGLPRAEVACLIGGQRFVSYTIERDDELIGSLIEAGERFRRRVEERDPPPADGWQSTTDALKQRFRDSVAEAVELGEEGVTVIERRHAAKARADEAKREQEECENRLRQLLGEHEMGLVFGEVGCTWKPNKAGVRRLIVKEIV